MPKKILTVLGARPQFIKASVVSAAIAQHPELTEVVVHTGQHFDANMSDVFFDELGMQTPAHQLDIHGGGHGDMTGRMLVALEQVMQAEKPDVVLVYGDTNSTLAGALAAVKLHIPVAHVEAGLRSFNLRMPEEVNRILTDRISRWLFTPTDSATRHLAAEGQSGEKVVQVGDVMYDVALHHGARVTAEGRALAAYGLKPGGYVLATIHRAENTDDAQRLTTIVRAAGVDRRAPGRLAAAPAHAGHPGPPGTARRAGVHRHLARNRSATWTWCSWRNTPPSSPPTPAACRRKRFPSHPLRHAARRNRMDRAGRRRLESPGAAGVQRRCRASRPGRVARTAARRAALRRRPGRTAHRGRPGRPLIHRSTRTAMNILLINHYAGSPAMAWSSGRITSAANGSGMGIR